MKDFTGQIPTCLPASKEDIFLKGYKKRHSVFITTRQEDREAGLLKDILNASLMAVSLKLSPQIHHIFPEG